MLMSSELRGQLSGMPIIPFTPSVSNLCFADDLLLFCKANIDEITFITSIFADFQQVSGQMVNYDKSACLLTSTLHYKGRKIIFEIVTCEGSING